MTGFFYATGLFCNLTVIVGSLAAGILPFVHFICSVSLALLKAFSGFFFFFSESTLTLVACSADLPVSRQSAF